MGLVRLVTTPLYVPNSVPIFILLFEGVIENPLLTSLILYKFEYVSPGVGTDVVVYIGDDVVVYIGDDVVVYIGDDVVVYIGDDVVVYIGDDVVVIGTDVVVIGTDVVVDTVEEFLVNKLTTYVTVKYKIINTKRPPP